MAISSDNKLFIHKYQPLCFNDFGENNEVVKMLKTLVLIDDINILLIGNIASGKTSLLNAIIREYYSENSQKEYEENVLYINSLKELEATELPPNSIGHVQLSLQQPLVTLPFQISRSLGSLVLVDTATHKTSAAVMVRE